MSWKDDVWGVNRKKNVQIGRERQIQGLYNEFEKIKEFESIHGEGRSSDEYRKWKKSLKKDSPEYTIVVDYGKPYNIKVKDKKELKKEINKLKKIYEEGDHPFFDIWIYDKKDNDITNECIKDGKILI